MTTEYFSGAPIYTIAGTGPYSVPHPYNWKTDLVVDALYLGVRHRLTLGTHYSVSPDKSETTGSVTLSSGRAAAYAGGDLIITRSTGIEQGWSGVAGPREKGLERQLDRLARAIQDNRSQSGRNKIAIDDLAAQVAPLLDPEAGVVPVETITVGVGTTGDYPDLPTADYVLRRHAATGARINLHIVSPLTRGWGIADRDCQNYHIHSDIGVVTLDAGFEGVDAANLYGDVSLTNMHLFAAYNATLPTLRCVIDMGGLHGDGYMAHGNSSGRVIASGGVINAGGFGARATYSSKLSLRNATFAGAQHAGIRLDEASTADARNSDVSGCCQDPVTEQEGAIDVADSSHIAVINCDASGSGAAGANIRNGSHMSFSDADLSGAAYSCAVFFNASSGAGTGANLSGATGDVVFDNTGLGINVTSGSRVHLGEATVKDNDVLDLRTSGGGLLIANKIETTNSVSGDGPPILADTNASAFNSWGENGAIIVVSS